MLDLNKVYPTVREAAIAGTRECIQRSRLDQYEYGGVVVWSRGGYRVAGIVTDYVNGSVNILQAIGMLGILGQYSRADIEEASHLGEGFFHVHPDIPEDGKELQELNSEFLSYNDFSMGIALGKLHYLGSAMTGKVFECDFRSDENLAKTTFRIITLSQHSAAVSPQEKIAIKGTEVFAGDRLEK